MNLPGAPTSVLRFLAIVLLIALLSQPALGSQIPATQNDGRLQALQVGQPLAEALTALRALDLDIFFTSHLVRPDMEVKESLRAQGPRALLEELLAPHDLHVVKGPGGRLIVVAGPPSPATLRGQIFDRREGGPIAGAEISTGESGLSIHADENGHFELSLPPGRHRIEARLPGYVIEHFEVELLAGEAADQTVKLEPAPVALESIIVTPSRISLLRDEPITALDFDRREIFALPHFGDDIFRALTLLPGVTGEESSARFNIRGSRADEVLVLLDRVELFEPYHLKDFGSRVSIIPPRTLSEVNLITGGFPAQYGDRMSGVLDMSSTRTEETKTLLGLGLLNTEIGSSGVFNDGRGHWLASARRSNLDIALDLLDIVEQPRYWGALGKIEYAPRPEHRLTVQGLYSDDSLDFSKVELGEEFENFITSYNNSYFWFTHQWILGPQLFTETAISYGKVERDRSGQEEEIEDEGEVLGFVLTDRRQLEAWGFKQDWSWQASSSHFWRFGFEARRLDTFYDYTNNRELDDLLASIRFEPRTGTRRFLQRLEGDQRSAYISDRWRAADDFVVEIGLRYDEQTLTSDRDFSPRFNLVWASSERSTLRVAWGYFFQSQRPYELQVEDGITELATAERTEQRVLGLEHAFGEDSRFLLRIEAYQRLIRNPRSRYENIFEPNSVFPEIEPDRILFAPDRGEAYGLELYVRGSFGSVDIWGSYAYSRVFDEIAGRRVPRRFDQPHAVTLDVNFPLGAWNANFAWRFHSGWPTTKIFGVIEEDDGELEAVPGFGPLNDERLKAYHRLDMRLSREWQRKTGVLGFFLEVQNLYNRRNQAGFDPDFDLDLSDVGDIELVVEDEVWDGLLPSFGITWEF